MKKFRKVFSSIIGLLLICSIGGNIVLASSYGAVKKNEKRLYDSLDEYEEDIKEILQARKEKVEEICDLYYEKKLRKLINKEELDYLAFMAWDYKIFINGEEIKSQSVETRSSIIKIVFVENKVVDNLPSNIAENGKFILNKENMSEYLSAEFKTEPIVKSDEDENGNRTLTYTFHDVQKGDVITLRLDPALIERMMLYEKINLQDDKIEIIRNR